MKSLGEYDYQYFKASRKFQNDPERIQHFLAEILKYNPQRVLDVGCGLGAVITKLNKLGVGAIGVDNAVALGRFFWKDPYFLEADAKNLPFDDHSFDVAFSSDFFEHVPEEEIDIVLDEMKRVGKFIVCEIAFESKLNKRQAKYHVTNKPKEWWKKKLPGVEILEYFQP